MEKRTKNERNRKIKKPSFVFACTTLIALILLIIIGTKGIEVIGLKGLNVDLRLMFFIAWLPAIGVSWYLGHGYKEIENSAVDTIRSGIQPAVILLVVGGMTSAWIVSGTVPTLIYYGLKIVNPHMFLPIVLVISSVTSLFTGTSWGTIGTVGLAMVGIGMGMDMNIGLVIGAVVSGAYFGDKMSPISDTTVMSSALAGVPVMKHIKHMLWTVVPGYAVTFLLFLFLGIQNANATIDYGTVNGTMAAMAANFKLGFVTLLPMILLFYLLATGKPSIPSILGAGLFGALIAIVYQGQSAGDVLNIMYKGYTIESGDAFVDTILSRGGFTSMRDFTNVMLGSFGFAGILKGAGILDAFIRPICEKVKTTLGATAACLVVEVCALATGSTQSFANVMTGTLVSPLYKQLRLKPENMSRAMEDFGTQGAILIPWGVNALYVAGMYGVEPIVFIPFCFLNILVPVISLIYGATGFAMTKYGESEEIPEDAYPMA
ncbi:MAG: Na+/H+ antiporter NhaC [Lachnospiraceae bacterium]|nr:Na+/H+ antiporter NhaC [Lachnospiraceae bacterium]